MMQVRERLKAIMTVSGRAKIPVWPWHLRSFSLPVPENTLDHCTQPTTMEMDDEFGDDGITGNVK